MSAALDRIRAVRARLGPDLMILGHYYQNADNLSVADTVGDSYQLAVTASRSKARWIVLCGVHFMAESVRILCKDEQRVLLPDHHAGCPMAGMVNAAGLRAALEGLKQVWGESPVPVLYVNSTAEVKALAGEAGGICCTSSNAAVIVRRVLAEGRRVFFVPDENLGRNVAAALGLGCMAWPPRDDEEQAQQIRMAVWRGYCPVHERMLAGDVTAARKRHPGCRVLVHPECTPEVAAAADGTGSPAQLLRAVESAPAGSTIIVGTESTFVTWMAARRKDVTVLPLRVSRCPNMAKITTDRLLGTLERLERAALAGVDGGSPDEVRVDEAHRPGARAALERMIRYTGG